MKRKQAGLPDENIAISGIIFDEVCHAVAVIAVTRYIHRKPKIVGQRLHRVIWTLSPPVYMPEISDCTYWRGNFGEGWLLTGFRRLRHDMGDVVFRTGPENTP